MIVYVVCGGDFPDSVWETRQLAEDYINQQQEEDRRNSRRIYWRCYEYEVRKEL